MSTPVWIGLGSNLGDRKANIGAAMTALAESPGVVVEALSAYHETRPVGGPGGQGEFLNAAARLRTDHEPQALLRLTQAIEDQLGRVRTVRWGERIIDIDLLIHGSEVFETPGLTLPHPRLVVRKFVLAPLAEVASEAREPISDRSIAELLENLKRSPRRLAIDTSGMTDNGHFLAQNILPRLPARLIRLECSARARSSDLSENTRPVAEKTWEICLISKDPATHPGLSKRPERLGLSPATWAEIEDWNPTCLFFLDRSVDRRPGLSKTPVIWLDSTDPESVAEEIVTTCQAIEGF